MARGGITRPNIGAYITRFNGRMGTFKRGVLLKLFGAVIKDTPVLTGRLRGAWTFSKGAPPEAFVLKPPTEADAQQTFEDPSPRITEQVTQGVKPEDDNYFLANNMPYCLRIEYLGWSHTKAPQGMVRKNIIRIAKLLERQGVRPDQWSAKGAQKV